MKRRNPTVGLVTFGDGGLNWKHAANRLAVEARASRLFSVVADYDSKSLQGRLDSKIWKFMRNNPKGYGYWIWKPLIILDFIAKNPEIEIVCYLDAGVELNINQNSVKKFEEYLQTAQECGHLVFALNLPEIQWTKRELFDALKTPVEDQLSSQIQATAFFMTKESASNFCGQWLEIMQFENFSLLTDKIEPELQDSTFRAHRHDQSIFSLLAKKYGPDAIIHEENLYFAPNWTKGEDFPFWAVRNRTGVKVNKSTFGSCILRKIDIGIAKANKIKSMIRKFH